MTALSQFQLLGDHRLPLWKQFRQIMDDHIGALCFQFSHVVLSGNADHESESPSGTRLNAVASSITTARSGFTPSISAAFK